MASLLNYTIIIKNDNVNIYRTGDANSDIIGLTRKGYKMVATERSEDGQWYFVPAYEGWVKLSNFTITDVDPVLEKEKTKVIITVNPVDISGLIVNPALNASSEIFARLRANSIVGIFAAPYQFSYTVDRRIVNASGESEKIAGIGRKYAERILSRNNLLFLQPGTCDFLPGGSKADKAAALNAVIDGEGGDELTANGRYYTFDLDYGTYFKYVNTAAHAVANLMGLQGKYVSIGGASGHLGYIDWYNAMDSAYSKAFNLQNAIVFYTDGLNSVSEDYGNSTKESSLVSQINGYSDTVKEINYIMGYGAANNEFLNDASSGFEATRDSIQQTVNEFTNGRGVLNAILGNVNTILSGGKLVFPEMWSDSDYDRSYSIDIKLRSPEADDLSIYLNIIIPLIHLIALTAPRDFEANGQGNGYMAPFLVRAFVRSLFNIDLGIITSLSITRGGEGNWAAATNLPTSVDVSLSIKDLYKSVYINDGSSMRRLVANDSEVEQLMTLAGMNYYDINAVSKAQMLAAIEGGNIGTIWSRARREVMDDLSNALSRWLT